MLVLQYSSVGATKNSLSMAGQRPMHSDEFFFTDRRTRKVNARKKVTRRANPIYTLPAHLVEVKMGEIYNNPNCLSKTYIHFTSTQHQDRDQIIRKRKRSVVREPRYLGIYFSVVTSAFASASASAVSSICKLQPSLTPNRGLNCFYRGSSAILDSPHFTSTRFNYMGRLD